MPFPKQLLNDDEEVAVDLHPHWLFFAKAVAWLVAAIIFGIFSLAVGVDVLQWVALATIEEYLEGGSELEEVRIVLFGGAAVAAWEKVFAG